MSNFNVGQTVVMNWPKKFAGKKVTVVAVYNRWYVHRRKPPVAALCVSINGTRLRPSGYEYIYPETCFVAANSNGITRYGDWLKRMEKV